MSEIYQRTQMLIGEEAVNRLKASAVMIFGIGGVGSFAAEAVARAGVGRIILVDKDTVSESNINRQLVALHSTIGKPKAEIMKKRINDINPNISVEAIERFCLPDNVDEFFIEKTDYVIDAVDTVSAKLAIVKKCKREGIDVISAMGAGNKLNPQDFEISDIYKTTTCPLCRVMRRELKNAGIPSLKVVYTKEEPKSKIKKIDTETNKAIPGSISFVPSTMGLLLAGECIKDIVKKI